MICTDYNFKMNNYIFISLRQLPTIMDEAAIWFHNKWSVPTDSYLKCMKNYINGKTEYGWYVCVLDNKIVGGLGVIENDFHNRKDLTPNICAVYTEEEHRCKGIAGKLLTMAIDDLHSQGISPIYLVTDHTNFYERYGWKFMCMVQNDGDLNLSRLYIHQ